MNHGTTDVMGSTNLICYMQSFVFADESSKKEPKLGIMISVIGEFPMVLDLLYL